jgi:beta-glucosidase
MCRRLLVARIVTVFILVAIVEIMASKYSASAASQPKVEARKTPYLRVAGLTFKDLNKNGVLDKYEDWRLPIDVRVEDLLSKMTLEEKAGLMIHASIQRATGPNGEVLDTMGSFGGGGRGGRSAAAASGDPGVIRAIQGRNQYSVTPLDSAAPAELIQKRNVRWVVIRPNQNEPPEITAKFVNNLQEMAEATRLGIPMTPSDNPRNGIRRSAMGVDLGAEAANPNTARTISQWPGQLGLSAIGDPAAVSEYAHIAAQEMRAMGIRVILGPQADVATEPRWSRIPGTFGEDADWDAQLVKAFVEGFQGKELGPDSVMTVTKHFPGDGPVKDGLDPHSSYGKWTIYPGGQFDYHLIPFKAAMDAGTGGIMGGYFIPVGKDTVGVNFSKAMLTGLLRDRLGYKGVLITDTLRSMPWGVEDLSEKDRQRMMLLAGIDQILSDNDPKYILDNVKDGSVPATRLDASARRILRVMFQLGLFEDPYVNPENAKAIVGNDRFVAAGHMAQIKSVVLLKNAANLLPAAAGKKVYVQNVDKSIAARYGTVVEDPKGADLAIIRVSTPVVTYPYGGGFNLPGAGPGRGGGGPLVPTVLWNTLAYSGSASQHELDDIVKLAGSGTPTVVCVDMDRPAILTEFIDKVAGVFAAFGADDAALLDLVYGKHSPTGKLPYDLPSDMPSVMAQAEDVAHDLVDPLFKFGFGLKFVVKK